MIEQTRHLSQGGNIVKVDGGNGKLYTRDNPHEIINPRVMRFEEIRGWLKELSTNPEYGWTPGGVAALVRSLGMPPHSLHRKLSTGWIWPKEQVRLTARIREILDGYIVPTRYPNSTRVDGVYHDPPIPPVVTPKPKTISFGIRDGKVSFNPTDMRPPPKLPNFRRAFEVATYWNPDARPKAR